MSEPVMHDEGATEEEVLGPPPGRLRTCIGCAERVDIASPDLVRVVFGPVDGGDPAKKQLAVAVDGKGGGAGRGAHLHARPGCLEKAAQKGLSRAAKGNVTTVMGPNEAGEILAQPASAEALARAIEASMNRRVTGLLITAARTRQLAIGADAVSGADQRGDAALIVVARDAAASADLSVVRNAVSEGRAVAWGTKETLAAAVSPGGREAGVGVVAITSRSLAIPLRDAVQMTISVRSPAPARQSGGAARKKEARTDERPKPDGATMTPRTAGEPRRGPSSGAPSGRSQSKGASRPERGRSGGAAPPRNERGRQGQSVGRPPRGEF